MEEDCYLLLDNCYSCLGGMGGSPPLKWNYSCAPGLGWRFQLGQDDEGELAPPNQRKIQYGT